MTEALRLGEIVKRPAFDAMLAVFQFIAGWRRAISPRGESLSLESSFLASLRLSRQRRVP